MDFAAFRLDDALMPFSQTDVDNLKAAIATGAKRVRFEDGRETEYRSLAEMKDALAMAESEVAGRSSRPRATYAAFDRD